MFREPLVVAKGGGRGGGGASLTELGETVVRLYRDAERTIARAARTKIDEIERSLAEPVAADA